MSTLPSKTATRLQLEEENSSSGVDEAEPEKVEDVTAGPLAHISLLDQHSELKKKAEGKGPSQMSATKNGPPPLPVNETIYVVVWPLEEKQKAHHKLENLLPKEKGHV